MPVLPTVSRRSFVGAATAALGALGVTPPVRLLAQGLPQRPQNPVDEYDAFAKLANNENPYGPPESVMKAMTTAFKYANRYAYPDGGLVDAIAKHHGAKPEQVLLGAGSG